MYKIEDPYNKSSEEFVESVKDFIRDQVYELVELENNFLENSKILEMLDIDFMSEIVDYCHHNYLPILSYTQFTSDPITIKYLFETLYELYIMDLPPFIRDVDFNLLILNEEELRSFFAKEFAWRRVRSILRLSLSIGRKMTDKESIKYITYTELFNNDISNFINNYLIPLL